MTDSLFFALLSSALLDPATEWLALIVGFLAATLVAGIVTACAEWLRRRRD